MKQRKHLIHHLDVPPAPSPPASDMGKDTNICSSRTARGTHGRYSGVPRCRDGAANRGRRQRNNLVPTVTASGLCKSLKINEERFFLNGLLVYSGLQLKSLSVLEVGPIKLHF